MRFVPYHKFAINTHLGTNDVMDILSQVAQAKRKFWPNPFSADRKPFVGTVSTDGFRFIRNVCYLNSFLPQIKGEVSASNGGAVIMVTMTFNPVIGLAFMAAPAFLGFFLTTIASTPHSVAPMIVATAGGKVFGYVAYTLGFKTQEIIDRRFLTNLFPPSSA